MSPDGLNERKTTALRAIKSLYGKPEGEFGPTLFVSHHLQELHAGYWIKTFGVERPSSDQILSALVFLGAWGSQDDETIDTFDFGLPDNVSNYLLTVRFQDEEVQDVSMES